MIPSFQKFLYPFLLAIKNGKSTTGEVKEYLKDYFKLTEDDCLLKTKGGKTYQLSDRINWCRQYFRRALFIDIPQRGTYQLTDRAKEYLKHNNELTIDSLCNYPEFVSFANGHAIKKVETTTGTSSTDKTPTELLEDAYLTIKDSLKDELLSQILEKDPSFFEQLVVDLLQAMGYGGTFDGSALVTKPTKDGGIDGIIKEDKLGLDSIYIQAKKWSDSHAVDAPEIQKFSGALLSSNATKGVFITTSHFTSGAVDIAKKVQQTQKIILIDGSSLTDYMIEFNVGVSTQKTYFLKKIDKDYFDDED
ncbi:MAG: restriction endonuclease [Paludibacteraceae bacterium]|nr:restriction endonuclease [Paludibacteraceae bacterium]